jgi:hypothetical protein
MKTADILNIFSNFSLENAVFWQKVTKLVSHNKNAQAAQRQAKRLPESTSTKNCLDII